MNILIKPDSGGFERLPECMAFLQEYMGKERRVGRKYGHLFVQQHSGKQWTFEIFETKTQFVIIVTTSDFEYFLTENLLQNGS